LALLQLQDGGKWKTAFFEDLADMFQKAAQAQKHPSAKPSERCDAPTGVQLLLGRLSCCRAVEVFPGVWNLGALV
jgi:hypothetical protein